MEEPATPEPQSDHRWASALIQGFLGSFEKYINDILDSAKRSTRAFVDDTMRRIVVFFLILIGGIFLVVGACQYLSAYWGQPGSGPLAVGGLLIVMGFLWYSVRKK